MSSLKKLIHEMHRRSLWQLLGIYVVGGWIALQIVDTLAGALKLPDWAAPIALVLLIIGLPIVLATAFVQESMRRRGPPGEAETISGGAPISSTAVAAGTHQRVFTWRNAMLGGLALIALWGVLVTGWLLLVDRRELPGAGAEVASSATIQSIAVLPFEDMSPEGNQEYFSDGISEELLNLLAEVPELLVAARTSSFSFKGQKLEIPEIAERLKVAHVLEGSVRKAGSRVRITAQLARGDDGFHVWSKSWDRSLEDIFAIQYEIAADVVAELKLTLAGAAPTVEETDPEAYALFLQARHLGRQRSADGYEQSNALYERSLEIDPDYAAAWAGLAVNYSRQANVGLRPIGEGFLLAREAANRALATEEESAEAYATLGSIAMNYDNDLAAAADHYRRALELAPTDTDIILSAARLAVGLGRLDDAVKLQEYAVSRDPVNPIGRAGLGFAYLWSGRLDESIQSNRTALSLSPGRIAAHYTIGAGLLLQGQPEEALVAIQQESSEAFRLVGLAIAYHALGQVAESDAALAELIDKYERGWAYNIAYVLAFRGEADRAFEWLTKAVRYHDPGLTEITVEPLFANIHDDSRWLPFLESIGKSPEQLAAIEYSVSLPE